MGSLIGTAVSCFAQVVQVVLDVITRGAGVVGSVAS